MRYNKYNNKPRKKNFDDKPQGMTVTVRDNDVNKALRSLEKTSFPKIIEENINGKMYHVVE